MSYPGPTLEDGRGMAGVSNRCPVGKNRPVSDFPTPAKIFVKKKKTSLIKDFIFSAKNNFFFYFFKFTRNSVNTSTKYSHK